MSGDGQAGTANPADTCGEELKEQARVSVAKLVERFGRNEAEYRNAGYNETQARTEFITPLLEAFGWDVHNRRALPLIYREVIEEATVEVGEERLSKRPDYELRLARQRKYSWRRRSQASELTVTALLRFRRGATGIQQACRFRLLPIFISLQSTIARRCHTKPIRHMSRDYTCSAMKNSRRGLMSFGLCFRMKAFFLGHSTGTFLLIRRAMARSNLTISF